MAEYPANFGELSYNEGNKQRFLRESKKLLDRVARNLLATGVVEKTQVSVNRAGIAVGGDVYGYFYAPGLEHGVLITITQGATSTKRPDRVVCYGQYRSARRGSKGLDLSMIEGSNVSPSEPLALGSMESLVRRMLQQHPAHRQSA